MKPGDLVISRVSLQQAATAKGVSDPHRVSLRDLSEEVRSELVRFRSNLLLRVVDAGGGNVLLEDWGRNTIRWGAGDKIARFWSREDEMALVATAEEVVALSLMREDGA